jgi:hypothetical protein
MSTRNSDRHGEEHGHNYHHHDTHHKPNAVCIDANGMSPHYDRDFDPTADGTAHDPHDGGSDNNDDSSSNNDSDTHNDHHDDEVTTAATIAITLRDHHNDNSPGTHHRNGDHHGDDNSSSDHDGHPICDDDVQADVPHNFMEPDRHDEPRPSMPDSFDGDYNNQHYRDGGWRNQNHDEHRWGSHPAGNDRDTMINFHITNYHDAYSRHIDFVYNAPTSASTIINEHHSYCNSKAHSHGSIPNAHAFIHSKNHQNDFHRRYCHTSTARRNTTQPGTATPAVISFCRK